MPWKLGHVSELNLALFQCMWVIQMCWGHVLHMIANRHHSLLFPIETVSSSLAWDGLFLSCEVYLSPDYPLTEPNPFVGVEDQRILNRSQVVRREDVWCTATSRLQSIAVPSSSLYSSTPRQTKHPSYACKQISEAELKLGFTVWKREYIRCTSTDKLLLLFIQWDTTAQWYSKSVGICAKRRSIRLGVDSATWVHL